MPDPTETSVAVALVGLGWWGQTIAGLVAETPMIHPRHVPRAPHPADRRFPGGRQACVLRETAGADRGGRLRRGARSRRPRPDLTLGIGHGRRFEPPVQEMIARADAGAFGRLLQIEGQFSHDKLMHLPPDNWRQSAENAPAAGMTATGIHLLDLSVRLMGPVLRVLATAGQLASGLPQGDTIAAHLLFEGGGGHATASLAMASVPRLAVDGAEGRMESRDKAHVKAPEGWVITEAGRDGPIRTRDVAPQGQSARDNLDAFARATRGGAPYPVRGAEIVAATALRSDRRTRRIGPAEPSGALRSRIVGACPPRRARAGWPASRDPNADTSPESPT